MKKVLLIATFTSLFIGFLLGRYFMPRNNHKMSHENQREEFIAMRDDISHDMREDGNYRCCLETPCTYCIEKTPGHGEGASCHCLKDIVEGRHPCGECIGEILEGHGNRFLSKYFATAIAEEVGQEHLETLQQIISQKYEISQQEQI